MGGIALFLIIVIAAVLTWLIVISAASLGIILQPVIVFIVCVLLIIWLSI